MREFNARLSVTLLLSLGVFPVWASHVTQAASALRNAELKNHNAVRLPANASFRDGLEALEEARLRTYRELVEACAIFKTTPSSHCRLKAIEMNAQVQMQVSPLPSAQLSTTTLYEISDSETSP